MKYQLVILFAVACLATSQKTTRSLEEMIEDEYTPKPTTPSQTTTTTLQPRFFFGSYPYERNCTCVPYSLCSPYTKNGTAYDARFQYTFFYVTLACLIKSARITDYTL